MKTNTLLDWIRYTSPAGAPLSAVDVTMQPFEPTLEPVRALTPYNSAVKLVAGRIDWHTNRPELKTMVTLTGSDLQTCAEMGVGYDVICTMAQQALGAVTRIDLAIDIYDGGKTAHDVWLAYKATDRASAHQHNRLPLGALRTRSRRARFVEGRVNGEASGDTCYFGSRQSDRMVRIYDKGKEQGMDVDWLRVEVELKGARAAAVAKQLQRGKIGAVARAVIDNAVTWDCDYWRSIMSGRAEGKPAYVPVKDTDTDDWFASVVMPYLRRQMERQGTDGLVYTALEALLQELSK